MRPLGVPGVYPPKGKQAPDLTPIRHKYLMTLTTGQMGPCTGESQQALQEACLPRRPREQLREKSRAQWTQEVGRGTSVQEL